MAPLNDVINYAKFYRGSEEPPAFRREELLDLREKLYVPFDDCKVVKSLNVNPKQDVVLHYYVKDCKQNILMKNPGAHRKEHSMVYASTSPDFSVDSMHCYSCLNISNILKSRIVANIWQNKYEERVILNLIWGNKDTYDMAFRNVEKGSIVSVSTVGVKDYGVFYDGLRKAIDLISPEEICWYGRVIDNIEDIYDKDKIIPMQSRRIIVAEKQFWNSNQLRFDFEKSES